MDLKPTVGVYIYVPVREWERFLPQWFLILNCYTRNVDCAKASANPQMSANNCTPPPLTVLPGMDLPWLWPELRTVFFRQIPECPLCFLSSIFVFPSVLGQERE